MSNLNKFPFPDNVHFKKAATRDFNQLDNAQAILVAKAIRKVSTNPTSQQEGGYGKPLRGALSGCLKIKIRHAGIRIIYQYLKTENGMEIVIIGMREDDQVYNEAIRRIK